MSAVCFQNTDIICSYSTADFASEKEVVSFLINTSTEKGNTSVVGLLSLQLINTQEVPIILKK